jgi:hypothetical protein
MHYFEELVFFMIGGGGICFLESWLQSKTYPVFIVLVLSPEFYLVFSHLPNSNRNCSICDLNKMISFLRKSTMPNFG